MSSTERNRFIFLILFGGALLSLEAFSFSPIQAQKRTGPNRDHLHRKWLDVAYAVVSMNYRLSGEAIWPAQIHDCKAAVRWIRANASTYAFNPGMIAAWGGSAGGHLSAMTGTSGGIESLEDLSLGNPEQSSRIQAVVNWFGPTDFLRMDEHLEASGVPDPMVHSVEDSPESRLLGKNLEDGPGLVRSANPETYISGDDPPFLIQHGMKDRLVPYQGSVLPEGITILDRETPVRSLEELTDKIHGKAIYLDRWASWCSPCLEEFRYNKTLHRFLEENNIQMIYLNSDKDLDEEKWIDFIQKYKLKGYHLRLNDALKKELADKGYFIPMIPQYMIINRGGQVVENRALRPSDGEDLYNQLLTATRPKIIFDTDIGGDADDLGALAMLHNFMDRGECDLLAVMCWSNEEYAVPAIDAVNRYYNHPEIPIGVRKVEPGQVDYFYNRAIAAHFPHKLTRDEVPDATLLYRELLAGQQDSSVTILAVGPLKNIQDLINSGPDEISPLTGAGLIAAKVEKFVVMGGKFPEGENEWNFNGNMPGVTKFVLENLETPVVFSGFEVGVQIKTGAAFKNIDINTPLYVGFSYFGQHCPYLDKPPEGEIINNSSYDQTAVLYAVRRGVGNYWNVISGGRCSVNENGDSKWIEGAPSNHSYLVLKKSPDELAELITSIMLNLF